MPEHARHLNLAGASNFRDIGGYPARDGRTVRWRPYFPLKIIFGHLTDSDIAVLRQLGVRSAFDFRGREERLAAMCVHGDITVHSLPVEPITVATLRQRMAGGKTLSAEDAADVMRISYRGYVTHNTAAYRTLFAHLIEDRAPLVIHCTAGKDRTGFGSALILHALGVSDDVIGEDYLLTNRYYKRDPAAAATDLSEDVRAVLGKVDGSFLAAAFDAVRSTSRQPGQLSERRARRRRARAQRARGKIPRLARC